MLPKPPNRDPGEFGRPAPSPRAVAGVVVLVLFFILTATSYYTVAPEEVGVVQRFGKYQKQTQPGLHFKLPFGIDRVTKVPVRRQLRQEFGFQTVQAGVRSVFRGPREDPALLGASLMVTGDLNMAVVEWIIQYRTSEPRDYLFNLRDPAKTLRDVTESVMREVIGDRTVDETLTSGRQEIKSTVFAKLQTLATSYTMGITIDQVALQDVKPPQEVEASFHAVNQAQQERERMINEAWAEYNKVVPRASGEALQQIQEAEGYATKRTNEALGDAARFNATLTSYLKAPDVTRRRIFLETMQAIIPKLGRKTIIDNDVQQFLPLLSLNAEQEVVK